MKSLSIWAGQNPILARTIIVFIHLFAILNAIGMGVLLYLSDWGKSTTSLYIFMLLFFVCYSLYPRKENLRFAYIIRHAYLKQKMLDFSMVMLYSMTIALSVNNFLSNDNFESSSSINKAPKAKFMSNKAPRQVEPFAQFVVNKSNFNKKPSTPTTQWSTIKKKVKQKGDQVKSSIQKRKRSPKNTKGGRIAMFILTMMLGTALAAAAAALACYLFCIGNPGLAITVLFAGAGGGVALIVYGARGLRKTVDKYASGEKKHSRRKHSRRR